MGNDCMYGIRVGKHPEPGLILSIKTMDYVKATYKTRDKSRE